jgi:integrase
MARPHVVPLSPAAIHIFQRAAKFRMPGNDLVFPGQKLKKPMSDMTLLKILRDMNAGVTVHGFRSAFRDWVADQTLPSIFAQTPSAVH